MRGMRRGEVGWMRMRGCVNVEEGLFKSVSEYE